MSRKDGGGEGDSLLPAQTRDCVSAPVTRDSMHAVRRTRALVFALVSAAFTSVYVTQPVLPVLQTEFGVTASAASLSISAIVAGIALASLPFGVLADRWPVQRLIGVGGAAVGSCCLIVATTSTFTVLVAARFVQGIFLPALTSSIAAYLARSLPPRDINIAMGAYVAATIAGGLGGRLLGGWIHPPLHWRYAFVTTTVLVFATAALAIRGLPPDRRRAGHEVEKTGTSVVALLRDGQLLRLCCAGAGAMCAFSSIFTYFPFYLSGAPLGLSTGVITSLYLTYVVGIVMGPVAGHLSNRLGNGRTMVVAALVFMAALTLSLVPRLPVLALALLGMCAGFFTVHAAAVGALNRALTRTRGRANALYGLFYYVGGALGITATGFFHSAFGWRGVVAFNAAVLLVPLAVGWASTRRWT
jgi:YNFM family putative membrane transporter